MADCRKCKHNYKPPTCEPKCNRMCDGESDFEPITNAMRIRAMSDEELAELFTIWSCEYADYTTLLDIEDCKWGTKQEVISRNLKWLQSEAE